MALKLEYVKVLQNITSLLCLSYLGTVRPSPTFLGKNVFFFFQKRMIFVSVSVIFVDISP